MEIALVVIGVVIIGWYSTPLEGGFLYNNGAYQPLAPKLPSYTPTGFNNSHTLIGVFESSLESFVLRGDELQQVYVDGSDFTSLTGINDFDLITGEYNDGSWHTFVFDGLDFTELEVPGARFTQIQGLSNSGILVGSYGVGDVIFGLIARPEPGDPTRSVFYEPISEPPVALLFFAALLSFEYFRRRQNLVDRDRKWS